VIQIFAAMANHNQTISLANAISDDLDDDVRERIRAVMSLKFKRALTR
jgi:hypothetical protein